MNDLGTTPEGHKIDAVGMKVVRQDRALTQLVRQMPHDVDAGDEVTFVVRAVKVKDNYEYELAGGSLLIQHVQVFSAVAAAWVAPSIANEAIEALTQQTGQGHLALCTVDHIEAWVNDTELTECPKCGVSLPVPGTSEGLHE